MKSYKVWVRAQVEEYDEYTDEFRNVFNYDSEQDPAYEEGTEDEFVTLETENAAEAFAFAEQLRRNLESK